MNYQERRTICQGCQHSRTSEVRAEIWCSLVDDQPQALKNCDGRKHQRWRERTSCTPLGKWELISNTRTLMFMAHAPKWPERLHWCENTWLRDAAEVGQGVVILHTSDRLELQGRDLYVPVPNSLRYLPSQIKAFCQWALQRNDWDYLFKCDDDTYVSIPRFIRYDTAGRDYIGGWCRYHGETYAHGGSGYFLSRRAATLVAEILPTTGSEDLQVGRLLREAGIPFSLDNRFVGWGNYHRRPGANNNIITTHVKNAGVFYASQAETGLHAPERDKWVFELPPPPETSELRRQRIRASRVAIRR